MQVQIKRSHGREHELLVAIPYDELREVRLSVPHWAQLARGEGMVRWRGSDALVHAEASLTPLKQPMESHLRDLGLIEDSGQAIRPVIAVGNRNLGNNIGFVAWRADGPEPRVLHLLPEPIDQRAYGSLCVCRGGHVSIRTLRFHGGCIAEANGEDLADKLAWCTSGMRILETGRIRQFEELVEDAYDVRHLLALDPMRLDGRKIIDHIYGAGATLDWDGLKSRVVEQWRAGVPRSRYVHSCVGVALHSVFLLLAEGTPEQLAQRLHDQGCSDALILDQGGSAGLWAWWMTRSQDTGGRSPHGGFLLTSPDYRPNGTSIIAFVLGGPVQVCLPPASAAPSIV
jgi:hypothetical protein